MPSRDKTITSFTQVTLSPLYRINVEDAGFEPGKVTLSHRVALLSTSQTNTSLISAVEKKTVMDVKKMHDFLKLDTEHHYITVL